MCEDAKAFMAEGYSKEATAGALGINKDTLYAWIKKYPDFSDAIKDGEVLSQKVWEEIGLKAVKGENSTSAGIWAITMKNRFGYRDKTETTHHAGQSLVEALKEANRDS